MSNYKVFISYSVNKSEMLVVWRLQTLGAAHGLTVYVPDRQKGKKTLLSDEIRSQIDNSDCVIAFLTTGLSEEVKSELNYATTKRKKVIYIVEKGIRITPATGDNIFYFDPSVGLPSQVEKEVIEYLRKERVKKEDSKIIGLLVGIGIGLLLLLALSKKQ